jgi:uncharacterized membrane protein YeaQ/YmgE (transglycosylase-associated protein family)
MKNFSLILTTLLLVPGAARAQALPDNPAPAPNPAWDRVQNLTNGTPVVVRNDNAPPVHCLFAGATDSYLFCDPPGNPPGVGFRFDRASIVSVDLDLPMQNGAQFAAPQRNYHPVWIASILAGGLIVGICATRTTDDGTAAKAGAIGALVVGVIGAPLAFLPHPQFAAGAPPPLYGARIPFPHAHLHFAPSGLR